MAAPWFPFLRPAGSPRLRLLLLPHAGGGAATYRSWARGLPAFVEVWAAQLPGRETRIAEPPLRRMQPLVAALADAVAPSLELPLAIFGHSMGALVAFELARELRRRGLPRPALLALSAHTAPRPGPRPPALRSNSDEDLLAHLSRLEGTPKALLASAELRALVLPLLRADLELLDAYQLHPEPPLDTPLWVLGAGDDPVVPTGQLEEWAGHTTAFRGSRLFSGGHFYHLTHREEVVGALDAVLRRL